MKDTNMASVVIIKNIFSIAMVFFEDAVLSTEPKVNLHTIIWVVRKKNLIPYYVMKQNKCFWEVLGRFRSTQVKK